MHSPNPQFPMEDMKYLVTLTCCHLTRKYYEILHNLFTKSPSCFLQLNLPGFLSIFLKVSMYPCFSIAQLISSCRVLRG